LHPQSSFARETPAISNGRIYFRTFDALWAVGKK
jgi:hypothetical protein